MLLKVKQLQEAANKILTAVDNGEISSVVNETLELVVKDNQLWLNVTNGEYYARVKQDIEQPEEFRAVVDAKLFLNLMSKLTSEDIELKATESTLVIKADGSYKLPLIYNGNSLVNIPEINIDNVTNEFNISSETLLSILNYNSRELSKTEVVKPVQRLYYVDEQGCITFTTGACVNSFVLPSPVKLLLNQKLVKLFRLFKEEDVKFTLGYDQVGNVIQTKVRFETDSISITAITSTDESLLKTVPAEAIRKRATANYTYQVVVSKQTIISALTRLLLFNTSRGGNFKNFGTLDFTTAGLNVYDSNKDNRETIAYIESNVDTTYSTMVDINSLKSVLDGCQEDVISLSFGNKQCVVISRGNVKNILPEAHQ